MAVGQPLIRSIQAVGQVSVAYTYNTADHILTVPTDVIMLGPVGTEIKEIDTTGGVQVTGFRLDTEFLRAAQQIASSVQIPLLGGGGAALTNDTRLGTLTFNCTSVSYPRSDGDNAGSMYGNDAMGVMGNTPYYDLVMIAQLQQGQAGGDSTGATLVITFNILGFETSLEFQGCTVAEVAPLALSGNDVPDYRVTFNYLNWIKKQQSNTAG